jgi:hypothetical protein
VLSEALAQVVGEKPPVSIRRHVLEGHPAFELLEQAHGADLLVVGSRGHGGFVGVLCSRWWTPLHSRSAWCMISYPGPICSLLCGYGHRTPSRVGWGRRCATGC